MTHLHHVECSCSVAVLEQARLRAHFRDVLDELGARDVSHLSDLQRARRSALLVELRAYATTGRFPKNRDFPTDVVPYFIDASGTRCAMAHLIESTGDTELVSAVATTRNHARIRELAGNAALEEWLERSGLTAAEAARIQPSYCFVTKADACLCDGVNSATTGVIEATVLEVPESGRAVVRVDVVHGDAGTVTVGAEVSVYTTLYRGDKVLVPVGAGQTMPLYSQTFKVLPGGEVEVSCFLDVPALSKDDAITALLAGVDDSVACTDSLATVDRRWGESQCEDGADDGGCATTGADASPLVLGTALLVATLRMRRSSRV